MICFYTFFFFGIVLPLLSGAMDESFDAAPFLIFPISRLRLFGITLAATLGSPHHLVYLPALIAVLIAGVARIGQFNGSPLKFALSLLGFVVLTAILFIASRNALQNYYARTNVLLSRRSHMPTATRDNPHQKTTARHR